ncbi:hypothetical protein BD626DRAFT_478838 [Schizophyllum amplum]|uniref:F-box domain-containing protein n=1 Tax=Schizophyllum amplum TaxID=97359 RepID=A0A550CRN3_9AGAR|nr:hypothetical protein BD626DRAFT_478838 [Auriculariopsis ampla]
MVAYASSNSDRSSDRHRAWDIPELVQLICEEAEHLPPAKTARGPRLRPIAALTQINRSFWTLAAPCLWRKQTSLTPLLKCLPSDAWEERSVDGRLTFRLTRPLTTDDCHRLFVYGPLVKCLDTTQAPDEPVMHREVYRMLSSCIPKSTLLPNLRRLYWQMDEGYSQLFFARFVGSKVTSVRLYRGTRSDIAQPHSDLTPPTLFLLALADSCPSVRELALASYDAEFLCDIVGNCWNTISSLTLSSLELSPHALGHLAELPNLQTLHMAVVDPHLPVILTQPGFRALTALFLYVPSIETLNDVLQISGSWPLQQVYIGMHLPSVATEWDKLINTLAAHFMPETLTALTITEEQLAESAPREVIRDQDVDQYLIGGGAIRPLARFHRLRSVTIQPYCGVAWNDADVACIARGWPDALELLLAPYHRPPRPPRTTLAALLAFAEHCPGLDYLQLATDATHPLPALGAKTRARLQRLAGNRLDYMHVGLSPLASTNTRSVAAFLAVLFPKVTDLGMLEDEGDEESEHERLWTEVQHYLDNQEFRRGALAEVLEAMDGAAEEDAMEVA